MKFLFFFPLVVCLLGGAEAQFNWCQICKGVEQQIENIIKNFGDNPSDVEGTIDHLLCDRLPFFLKPLCDNEVKQYLPDIMNWIHAHDSGNLQLCQLLHACPSLALEDAPTVLESLCGICQGIAQDADNELNGLLNKDEASVQKVLDQKFCGKFPKILQGFCDKLVAQNIKQIVNDIQNEEKEIHLCVYLKLCKPSMMEEESINELSCPNCQKAVKTIEGQINKLVDADQEDVALLQASEVEAKSAMVVNEQPQMFQDQHDKKLFCGLCQKIWKDAEPGLKKDLQNDERNVDQKITDTICQRVKYFRNACMGAVDGLEDDVNKWLNGEIEHLPFCKDIKAC